MSPLYGMHVLYMSSPGLGSFSFSYSRYGDRSQALHRSFRAPTARTTAFTAIVRCTHDGIIAEIPMISPK